MSTLALGQKDTLQKPLGNWAYYQGQTNGYFLEKDGDHLFQDNMGYGLYTQKYQVNNDN